MKILDNMIKKITPYIKAKYHYYIKLFILNTFYKNNFTQQHLQSPTSNIIAVFIFQRIIGINRHIKFPVHFTNIIGRTGFLDIDKSSINSFMNTGIYLQTINGIVIKKNTIIASGTKIISANHSKMNITNHDKSSPIVIGNNCWIGVNVVILPKVELFDNTIIGAGSVVTKSILEKGKVVVGNPAKEI